VSAVADPQVVGETGAALGEVVELLDHAGRIEHHARRNHAGDARRENPAGKQRELIHLVAHDDGMPRVRAALITDDEIVLRRQQVDDLPLGFVAPLQTDDTRSGHGCSIGSSE
jgi:hypothetical protein